MELGEYLTKYRKAAGITIDDLAARSGVPKGTINKIIAGTTKSPTLDTVCSLADALGKTICDFMDSPDCNKKAPSLSDEAMKIAHDYSDLDHYGKTAVRDLIGTEKRRCEDDTRLVGETAPAPDPIFVNLYSEPSAAGIAVPTMGKDYTPYELKPDDPQGAAYAVRVQGNSMEPAFYDGDIAFVNHDALANGDIGIFCVDGGTVIKQYYHDPLGMTYLFSLNRARSDADVVITPTGNQTLVCQGRVITSKRYPIPGKL